MQSIVLSGLPEDAAQIHILIGTGDRDRHCCLLYLWSTWGSAGSIHACDCDESKSFDERFNEASAVFLGRVTRMHFEDWPFDIDSADVPPDEPVTVKFSVRTVWKGEVPETMRLTTIRSSLWSRGCGYPFDNHVDYVVYADGQAGALEVRACSHTKPAAEAQQDLDALGEGYAPEPVEKKVIKPATLGTGCNANAETVRTNLVSWPLGLIAGMAWFGFRRRRRR